MDFLNREYFKPFSLYLYVLLSRFFFFSFSFDFAIFRETARTLYNYRTSTDKNKRI